MSSKGVYKGGKPKLNADQVAQLRQRAHAGEKKAVLARQFGISRETLYSYLRTEKLNKPKSQPGWVEERVHPIQT